MSALERPCQECGQPIPPKRGPGRPASRCDDCRDTPVTCLSCGKQFPGHPTRRFCSRSCSARHRHLLAGHRPTPPKKPAPPKKECFTCGKTFDWGAKTQKFCSDACHATFTAEALEILRERKADHT